MGINIYLENLRKNNFIKHNSIFKINNLILKTNTKQYNKSVTNLNKNKNIKENKLKYNAKYNTVKSNSSIKYKLIIDKDLDKKVGKYTKYLHSLPYIIFNKKEPKNKINFIYDEKVANNFEKLNIKSNLKASVNKINYNKINLKYIFKTDNYYNKK